MLILLFLIKLISLVVNLIIINEFEYYLQI